MSTGLLSEDLLPSEDFGEIESLTFVGNGIAEFKAPGGVTGLLNLNPPAGPTQTTITLGGVLYTTTFDSTEKLIAVSGSDGQRFTIYPLSTGFVRVVYNSLTLGETEVIVPVVDTAITESPDAGRRLKSVSLCEIFYPLGCPPGKCACGRFVVGREVYSAALNLSQ